MPQLIMYWKNDGSAPVLPKVPEGCEIRRYTELDGAMARFEAIVDALELTEDDKFIPSSMK